MSFALTKEQLLNGTKTVTRRLGWDFLKPGDVFCAVEKGMGLKKGEKVKRLAKCRVIDNACEVLIWVSRGDCIREGFPDMSPAEFVEMFCNRMKCKASDYVNRIEFEVIEYYEV